MPHKYFKRVSPLLLQIYTFNINYARKLNESESASVRWTTVSGQLAQISWRTFPFLPNNCAELYLFLLKYEETARAQMPENAPKGEENAYSEGQEKS